MDFKPDRLRSESYQARWGRLSLDLNGGFSGLGDHTLTIAAEIFLDILSSPLQLSRVF